MEEVDAYTSIKKPLSDGMRRGKVYFISFRKNCFGGYQASKTGEKTRSFLFARAEVKTSSSAEEKKKKTGGKRVRGCVNEIGKTKRFVLLGGKGRGGTQEIFRREGHYLPRRANAGGEI